MVFLRERTLDAGELDIYAKEAPAAREGHDLTPLAFYAISKCWKADDRGRRDPALSRYAGRTRLVSQPRLPGGTSAPVQGRGIPRGVA
jgi:hypothetical protein